MTRSGTVPSVRNLVHMAVKAEQFQSSPSEATVWIPVCERACSVTSRALDVSRDKVFGVMFLQRVRGHYPSHKKCTHPHTHFLADKILTALVQWCVTARVQSLARWHQCYDRSQGEHLPHLPEPRRQQCGRCRRRCTRKIPAGNGFDV